MRIFCFVLAFALIIALAPGVATAADAQVHFTVVNQRAAAVLIYRSSCQGDTMVDGGRAATFECPIPIGGALTLQIRNANMQGVLCMPYVNVTAGPNSSFIEMHARQGTKYCTMVKTGPTAYTIEIDADQGSFTIETRSRIAYGVSIIANNDTCTPRFHQRLNPGASIDFTCARAAVAGAFPLEVTIQNPDYTVVLCFVRWINGLAEIKHGSCTVERAGPTKDILTLH
jgi:hypothetical protein